jgi:hypothetical protein
MNRQYIAIGTKVTINHHTLGSITGTLRYPTTYDSIEPGWLPDCGEEGPIIIVDNEQGDFCAYASQVTEVHPLGS